MFTVRSHEPADEVDWLRCRVLSSLDSAALFGKRL